MRFSLIGLCIFVVSMAKMLSTGCFDSSTVFILFYLTNMFFVIDLPSCKDSRLTF